MKVARLDLLPLRYSSVEPRLNPVCTSLTSVTKVDRAEPHSARHMTHQTDVFQVSVGIKVFITDQSQSLFKEVLTCLFDRVCSLCSPTSLRAWLTPGVSPFHSLPGNCPDLPARTYVSQFGIRSHIVPVDGSVITSLTPAKKVFAPFVLVAANEGTTFCALSGPGSR